jgi:hypothetical protein
MEREQQDATAGGVRMTDMQPIQQAPVSEPAKEISEDRFFQNSFFVVVIAIVSVVGLVGAALTLASFRPGVETDALSAMLGTGTTIIGTLVGSFLGLRQGQQGRDEAQERSEQSRQETERVAWSALAYVPSDKAEEILKSARSFGVGPS